MLKNNLKIENIANSFALHIIVIFAAILKRHIYCITTQQFFCGYKYIHYYKEYKKRNIRKQEYIFQRYQI